nr:MAG TPA: hypothetical protein [Caudoviricetes sp.]
MAINNFSKRRFCFLFSLPIVRPIFLYLLFLTFYF